MPPVLALLAALTLSAPVTPRCAVFVLTPRAHPHRHGLATLCAITTTHAEGAVAFSRRRFSRLTADVYSPTCLAMTFEDDGPHVLCTDGARFPSPNAGGLPGGSPPS